LCIMITDGLITHRKEKAMQKITVEAIRTNMKMNQEQFARTIGMAPSTYIKKEQGVTDFTFKEITKIAEVSGFDLSHIKCIYNG